MNDFKLLKIGKLKYDRIKSMSILKNKINSFGYKYTYNDIKELFNSILENRLDETFNLSFKKSFDCIFDGNEYIQSIDNSKYEQNFNTKYIPPIG